MGQFSFKTSDTQQSISCVDGHKRPVWMLDAYGNAHLENDYEGYGVFGGVDFYELLAKQNTDLTDGETDRDAGILLWFDHDHSTLSVPKLVFCLRGKVEDQFDMLQPPEDCHYQGYVDSSGNPLNEDDDEF